MIRRVALSLFVLAACKTQAAPESGPPSPSVSTAPLAVDASKHIGAAVDPNANVVALADIAKNPDAFAGKTFTTAGTVTAVCAHMGCWMELKDDASQAHVKMAGHSFFVPKNASGKKARIVATLQKGESAACSDEDDRGAPPGVRPSKKKGCRAEAEDQLGRPLAKLELVAGGVEFL